MAQRYASTTTALPGSGSAPANEWSDTMMPVGQDDNVVGVVKTDQAGTLYVEQSKDATNWDLSESTAVSANTGTKFSFAVVAPYIRVRFVNTSVTAQTFLRLAARFSSAGPR